MLFRSNKQEEIDKYKQLAENIAGELQQKGIEAKYAGYAPIGFGKIAIEVEIDSDGHPETEEVLGSVLKDMGFKYKGSMEIVDAEAEVYKHGGLEAYIMKEKTKENGKEEYRVTALMLKF